MQTIAAYLHQDHLHCDQHYDLAETQASCGDWDGARRHFSDFLALFGRHLDKEERVLFPRLDHALGNAYGPTHVMRAEHRHMRDTLAQMEQALARRSSAEFFDHADTLRILMRQHNLKEEGILYPQADQVLQQQAAAVVDGMKALDLTDARSAV